MYVPMTPLPDARVPLLLTESTVGRFLVEAQMVGRATNPATELIPAGFRVRDEEVPDEGLSRAVGTNWAGLRMGCSGCGCRARRLPGPGWRRAGCGSMQ